ncbi:hypothetical protein OS175_06775 [Marinicella sp. S1101]|uniref:hypothetical protein n=1 Tax=Marinicella marina TaxID=2996016 RepID=UPI0024BC699D|nr:hypothetical protein [Marinicella marina]MCX7553578.1 hypothetical protein [Marinicella marina]
MKTENKFHLLLLLTAVFLTQNTQAAVHISQNNQGQAIVFPYFTVANDLNTLFSISNEQNTAKAVKINIREGKGGDAMYSLNLYLGAQDTWTMALVETDGFINLLTGDESCVINLVAPDIESAVNWDWQTGMVEVIEMGNFSIESELFFPNPFTNDITTEENCQNIISAWTDSGVWTSDSSDNLNPVSGGLTGQVSVFDVARGFTFQVPSVTLNDFFPSGSINHFAPNSGLPDLNSGDNISSVLYQGNLITTVWPTGYEAVSALLMKTSTSNDFTLEAFIDAKSEWVISFPTLNFHLNNNLTTEPFMTSDFNTVLEPGQFFFSQYTGVPVIERSGLYDRDGRFYFTDLSIVDPPPPPSFTALKFDSMVNTTVMIGVLPPFIDGVRTFPPSTISGEPRDNVFHYFVDTSSNPNLDTGKRTERIQYQVNDRGIDQLSQATQNYHGLPFIAFAYSRYTNANAQPGLLATYSSALMNRSESKID